MHLQEQAAINPKETLSVFRNQLTYNVQQWTLGVMLPLTFWQYYQGYRSLSILLAVFSILLAHSLWQGRHQPLRNYQAQGYVILASCCVLYSTWLNAHQGVYWAFPVIATYFFMLRPDASKKAALTFMLAFIPLVAYKFELDEALRVLSSLAISTLLVSYFATMVLRLHKDLVRLATCDPLTGCLNRSQLETLLSQALEEHKQKGTPYTLLLLDLDHFKEVNDRHGHHQGDLLLQGFADKIRDNLRPEDRLFRLGGEEFLVFFHHCGGEQAIKATERLLEQIRTSEFADGLTVTSSAGIAEAHSSYKDWSLWLHQADEVLYQAKTEGRDSYRVATGH
ncbi:diguanylate cyclase (GGDEF) domain-containing protein [Marinospirillum celere]|uniref:diguanylate cyclase n=1 Tax=Marinospirillum celere TaxID=1122252 RepID=A0A1I1EH11_9GAMM|nr:GGDEF domain-containing protein [Marinospirillum celere]SFB84223.1 diguanylate cyclase (GGDEF) domain-containing protein [Marinospirillum celere]